MAAIVNPEADADAIVAATRRVCGAGDLALRLVRQSNPTGWLYVAAGCPDRASEIERSS